MGSTVVFHDEKDGYQHNIRVDEAGAWLHLMLADGTHALVALGWIAERLTIPGVRETVEAFEGYCIGAAAGRGVG